MRLGLALTMILAATGPAHGGAWPRGEDNGFVSLKYESRFDRERLLLQDFTSEDRVQVYGEWGASPRLTFGGEFARSGPEIAPIREGRVFFRYTFLQSGAHVASGEFGFGRRSNDFGYEVSYLRPSLAWGRGFESRFGSGWVEIDAASEVYTDGQYPALKLDATLGLNLSDRFAVMLQSRAGSYPELDPYLRIAPSVVVRLTQRIRVQAEAEAGVYEDTGVAAALAVWIDF